MLSYIYIVFDKTAGTYSAPFLLLNDAYAERFLQKYSQGRELSLPTDFEIYKAGEYDANTGSLKIYDAKTFIARGEQANV